MPSATNHPKSNNSPQTYNRIGRGSFLDNRESDSDEDHSVSARMNLRHSTNTASTRSMLQRGNSSHTNHTNSNNNRNHEQSGFSEDIELVSEETINMNYLGGNTRQSLNQPLSFDETETEQEESNNSNNSRSPNARTSRRNSTETTHASSEDLNDNNHNNTQENVTGNMNNNSNTSTTERMSSLWGRMGGTSSSNGERRRIPGFRTGSRSVFNAISSSSPSSSRPTSPSQPSTPSQSSQQPSQSSSQQSSQQSSQSQTNIPEKHKITLTILDSAQSKFELHASIKWTTQKLKIEGQKIHSIPPAQQRLISMGKLLQDDQSLEDQGIGLSYQNNNGGNGGDNPIRAKAIIHLFPKPNVVISDNNNDSNHPSSDSNPNDSSDSNNNNENNTNRAHVPQIILDSEELSRRGQILVLSSHEAYEAMHRVRLLSFLLLAYSTLQILRDVTIYLAPSDGYDSDDTHVIPPGDPTDTSSRNEYEEDELPEWQNRDYIELAIAGLGVYVALLGMKATTDHVAHLAKKFVIFVAILGIAWTLYILYCHVMFNLALEESLGEQDDDHLALRVSVLETTLPFFLWVMFYVRAMQFYTLIREAEREANERVLGFLPSGGESEDAEAGSGNNGSNGGNSGTRHDLELQVEHGTIT